jgi:nitronate monooxygenase
MPLPAILTKRVRIPVMAAPLCSVSSMELTIAQCKAGIIGSFPAQNAPTNLPEWLSTIGRELQVHDARNPHSLSAPFAVGITVHQSNKRLDNEIACMARFNTPIVITTIRPDREVNDFIHGAGGLILHVVTSEEYARKAIDRGADGLIAVAAGAGGYAGIQSPFALMQEIRRWFRGPLLLGGSIASGSAILAARALGADLAYMGSAFIATSEANAPITYKHLIAQSTANDVVGTSLFNGVHANVLRKSVVAAGLDPNASRAEASEINFATLGDRVPPGAQIWSAGHGIGAFSEVTYVSHLIARLISEYYTARDALFANTQTGPDAPLRVEGVKWPRGPSVIRT